MIINKPTSVTDDTHVVEHLLYLNNSTMHLCLAGKLFFRKVKRKEEFQLRECAQDMYEGALLRLFSSYRQLTSAEICSFGNVIHIKNR